MRKQNYNRPITRIRYDVANSIFLLHMPFSCHNNRMQEVYYKMSWSDRVLDQAMNGLAIR